MLIQLTEVVARIDATEGELVAWVNQGWIRPAKEDDGFWFDDADVARIQLIIDLRRDMAVNDEAVPVILRLLDQVYGLRRMLGNLGDAIQELPDELRREVVSHLGRPPKP